MGDGVRVASGVGSGVRGRALEVSTRDGMGVRLGQERCRVGCRNGAAGRGVHMAVGNRLEEDTPGFAAGNEVGNEAGLGSEAGFEAGFGFEAGNEASSEAGVTTEAGFEAGVEAKAGFE